LRSLCGIEVEKINHRCRPIVVLISVINANKTFLAKSSNFDYLYSGTMFNQAEENNKIHCLMTMMVHRRNG